MLLSQQDDVCPPSIRITFVDGELIAIVPAFRRIRLTAFSITIAIEDRTHTYTHRLRHRCCTAARLDVYRNAGRL
jgi:hypothetical protein